jgi:hypothetical protein
MPEVGRPLMQQAITGEPGQAQFYILAMTRRTEALDRLREDMSRQTAVELALAPYNDDQAVTRSEIVVESTLEAVTPTLAMVAVELPPLAAIAPTPEVTVGVHLPAPTESTGATAPIEAPQLPEAIVAAPAVSDEDHPISLAALPEPRSEEAMPAAAATIQTVKLPRARPLLGATITPIRHVKRLIVRHRLARAPVLTPDPAMGLFGAPPAQSR